MRAFDSLSEREILALAISLEEEEERVYADFAEGLRESFPASAAVFDAMREEETTHRERLLVLYRERFGEHIPLIRRQDVKGFVNRRPVWLVRPLGLDAVRRQAAPLKLRLAAFTKKPRAGHRMQGFDSYWMTWHRKGVAMKTVPGTSRQKNCAPK
jgi:erythrin-vacuolar iron transport family protein